MSDDRTAAALVRSYRRDQDGPQICRGVLVFATGTAEVIHQILGPVLNLVGDGGFRAWTIGSWFFLKYSNLVVMSLVGLLFLIGVFLQLPGSSRGDSAAQGQEPGPPGEPQ